MGLLSDTAVAGEWEVTVVGRLPEVNSMALAPDGSLWYLTPTGAYRSTGFGDPKKRDDFSEAFFTCDRLFVSRTGAVWTSFPGDHRVIRSVSGKRSTIVAANGLLDRRLRVFAQTHAAYLLMGTDRGVLKVADTTGVSKSEMVRGTESLDVRAMLALSDGSVLLGTTSGIHRLDRALNVSATKWVTPDQTVEALASGNEGDIWIASGGDLAIVGTGSPRRFGNTDGLPFRTNKVAVDADGRIWLAGAPGLAVYENGRFMRLGEADGVTDEHVTALLADTEHNVWVGTRTGGLLKIRRPIAVNLGSGEPGDTMPQAMAVSGDGSVWMSHTTGLRRYRLGHPVQVETVPGIVPGSLVRDPGNEGIWATTSNGLWHWRTERIERIGKMEGLPGADPLAVAVAPDGSLWISWRTGGVTHAQHNADHSGLRPNPPRFDEVSGLCQGPYTTLAPRKSGGIWAGSTTGISEVDETGRGRCLTEASGLRSATVTSLWADDDGTLWAGTTPDAGIVRVRNGRVEVFTESAGLLCDSIQHVAGDAHNNLWIGCPSHVFRVSKSELDQVANRAIDRVHCLGFGLSDGINSAGTRSVPGRGLVVDRNDSVWVLTPGGASRIDSLSSLLSLPASSPWVTSVQASGVDLPIMSNSELVSAVGNGGLAFTFQAVRLSIPGRARFRYYLSPHENRWNETPDLAVHYKGLPAGAYQFKVAASNGFGAWSAPVSIHIRLAPPFYSNPWFLFAGFVGLAFAISGFLLLRVRRIRLAMAAVQQERERIARDLHDGVAQGFTSMGLHLETIERQILGNARGALGTAAQMRTILAQWHADIRTMIWTLRKNERDPIAFSDAIREAVKRARRAVDGKGVHISTDLGALDAPNKATVLVQHELPFIVQEAVTNSLKHGQARHIKVSVQSFDDELIAIVEDDGKGMSTDWNIETLAEAGHFGIIGMQERARRIGGTLSFERASDSGTRIMVCVLAA